MKKLKKELVDSVSFLFLLNIVGGFLDVYTFVTRGGVFANTQTTNLAKLGIELSQLNWMAALSCIYPIMGCMLGAMAAELIKKFKICKIPSGWHLMILIFEAVMLFVIGFVPNTVPNSLVNISLSFITSFQLSAFRKLEGGVCNTTICTGNIRSVGQFLYEALDKKTPEATKHFIKFGCVVFSFGLGALIGAIASRTIGVKAVWICCVVLVGLIISIIRAPHKQ